MRVASGTRKLPDERGGPVVEKNTWEWLSDDRLGLDDPLLQRLASSSPEPPKPPDRIGPYHQLTSLGRGGMGIVYRAEHSQTQKPVAIKTVRVPNQKMLSSIRREIHLLASMRHPGIVQILDQGVHQGLPWYAMELLDGVALRHLLDRSSQHPSRATIEVATAVDLTRRLCRPLAYLHGEGLVHRDLKPDNIMVQPDGQPVLVDFGLASRFSNPLSREQLEIEGGVMGTALYMAPEQIKGEPLDARTDLYALGCILYELVTGKPPFMAERLDDLLQLHLEQPPAFPPEPDPQLPLSLKELILSLLKKQRQHRPGYATEVAAALPGREEGEEPSSGLPEVRPYLYRPRLSGRRSILEQLTEALLRTQRGPGELLLVGGESGVGKTRLLADFGQHSAREGRLVLPGQCLERGGHPLEGLRGPIRVLADLCRERGSVETERLFGSGGSLLARYEPALADLPGFDRREPPLDLPPSAVRRRLFQALAESLATVAREWPLLLLLDDLQWADELTLGFLRFLTTPESPARQRGWLTVGAYRQEESVDRLAPLLELDGVDPLTLDRLAKENVAEVIGDMLALTPPPRPLVQLLSQHSEGNPLFVAEYLRAAMTEGFLSRTPGGRWQINSPISGQTVGVLSQLSLPHSIYQLVGRRLSHLSPSARKLVDAAAVLGRSSPRPLLWRVAGLPLSQLFEATNELLNFQLMEETRTDHLRFAHDKLREVAHQELGPTQRREGHHTAAKEIEKLFGSEAREWAASLGFHWEAAQNLPAARRSYLLAARVATEQFAFDEAERLYRCLLALEPVPPHQSRIAHRELAMNVYEPRGRFSLAEAECRRALEHCSTPADSVERARLLSHLGKLCRIQGRREEAGRALQEAVSLLFPETAVKITPGEGAGNIAASVKANVLGEMAILHHVRGQVGEAEAHYRQALQLLSGAGPEPHHSRERSNKPASTLRKDEGRILSNLGILCQEQGRVDEAQALYQEALQIQRAEGNRRIEGTILGNLANLHRKLGHLDEAAGLYQQALVVKREVEDWEGVGFNLGNLANLHREQTRPQLARSHYEEALRIAREIGNRRLEEIILGNLASFHYEQGRPVLARKFLHQALDLASTLGDRGGEGVLWCYLARLELEGTGRIDEAEQMLVRARDLLAEVEDSPHLVLCFCQLGHVALARGLSGQSHLGRAKQLQKSLGLAAESELQKSVDCLRRAQRAFDSGQTNQLFRGQLTTDFPPALHNWLIQHGHLKPSGE